MKSANFQTPILFLLYNRPELTEIVFQQIRAIKPEKLYISADGPNPYKPNDIIKCEEARAVVQQIDWECEVKYNFFYQNQGCKKAISTGIDWFFENEEEGIILEDDCVPSLSFFHFCKEMLQHYRYDEQVMHISGANFQFDKKRGNASYYFSNCNYIWGWATWRRAWKKYDVNMEGLKEFIEHKKIEEVLKDESMQAYIKDNFLKTASGLVDTWDFQWSYTMWKNGGLSVNPNVNMISNIGFGYDATHTKIKFHKHSNMKRTELNNIVFTEDKSICYEGDAYGFKMVQSGFTRKLMAVVFNNIYHYYALSVNIIASKRKSLIQSTVPAIAH